MKLAAYYKVTSTGNLYLISKRYKADNLSFFDRIKPFDCEKKPSLISKGFLSLNYGAGQHLFIKTRDNS